MKIIERYAGAVNTSDLRDDERHHQTDILAAVALSSKLGSLLHRAKNANDQYSIIPLLELWRAACKRRAKEDKWKKVAEEVADISLWYWLDDLCQVCKGRGHPVIIDTPTLEAATCQDCHGTGRKKLQCSENIKGLVLDGVQILDRMANEAGCKAAKKLL